MKQIFLCVLSFTLLNCVSREEGKDKVINYVALGDSYTICEGAQASESWPVILAKHLNEAGISVDLAANPSRTGWTTQDLIDNELSVFDAAKAGFVTLCIGVNDYVQGVDSATFHQNLAFILDHVQEKLQDKKRIVLITIPDYSVTPTGARYAFGRDVPRGISEFNGIILSEAKKRDLKTVDLFPISQGMKNDKTLIAHDGLHPSAKEYALWEGLILPVAKSVLKK
jgi:lysophospholipase L1-like esterase